MTWRDDMSEASLDGVVFLHASVEDEGGRRNVTKQFPGRDAPYTEDLGALARRWTLDAFLIGENYHVDLADLRDVLDAAGTKVFIHPHDGEFEVELQGAYKVTRSDSQGGMATIRFTLVEAGESAPRVVEATAPKVAALAAAAVAALEERNRFSLLGAIRDVTTAVAGALGSAVRVTNAAKGKVNAQLSQIETISALADTLEDSITDLMNAPQQLMNALTNMVGDLVDLVRLFVPDPPTVEVVEDVADTPGILLGILDDVGTFEAEPTRIPTATAQSDIEVSAVDALNLHMQGATLALVSAAAAEEEPETAADADALSTALEASHDALMETPDLDPEVYEAFAALKGAVVAHFQAVGSSLPRLANYRTYRTMPALLIAHELYGDATRADEVVARNGVRHPLFVPGGLDLEVADV